MSINASSTGTSSIESNKETLERQLRGFPRSSEGVLPALLAVQDLFGYLPEWALEYVASEFDTPLADVLGVATFYSQFSLKPQGEHVIRVCMGTACHVNGSEDVLDRLQSELDVLPGEVTDDDLFTLTTVRCVGACGLAPVVMVDDDVHGERDPDDIPELIEAYTDGGD